MRMVPSNVTGQRAKTRNWDRREAMGADAPLVEKHPGI